MLLTIYPSAWRVRLNHDPKAWVVCSKPDRGKTITGKNINAIIPDYYLTGLNRWPCWTVDMLIRDSWD